MIKKVSGSWTCSTLSSTYTPTQAEIIVADFQGRGTTNTEISYFNNTLVSNGGTSISMSSDSSAGTSFTINEAGVYYIYLSGHILWSTNQHLAVSLVKNSVVQESSRFFKFFR